MDSSAAVYVRNFISVIIRNEFHELIFSNLSASYPFKIFFVFRDSLPYYASEVTREFLAETAVWNFIFHCTDAYAAFIAAYALCSVFKASGASDTRRDYKRTMSLTLKPRCYKGKFFYVITDGGDPDLARVTVDPAAAYVRHRTLFHNHGEHNQGGLRAHIQAHSRHV